MFYAYVLKSIEHDFYYKGHCEDVQKRLEQHNSGKTKSIKHYTPFTIVYLEAFPTREEAIRREHYFKSASGRKFIKGKLHEKNTLDIRSHHSNLKVSKATDTGSLPD